jgi:DNA-directed RNA polymerase specialized sigma subunit
MSKEEVTQALQEANEAIEKAKATLELAERQRKQVIKLATTLLTQKEIAKVLGLSQQRVQQMSKEV